LGESGKIKRLEGLLL